MYLSVSYWNAEKKRPDNRKTRIGKLDIMTGEPLYTQEYLDSLVESGKSIEGMRLWDKSREVKIILDNIPRDETVVAREVLSSTKDFGSTYFLRELANKIGLVDTLKNSLPGIWQEVFWLACFLVCEDKPVMYCDDWVNSHDGVGLVKLGSQRISDLLISFGEVERATFYRAWYKLIREREYIALDITSVSSYSNNIEYCEWGYNRDGEDLPQVNICMLFGEQSRLPVYQTIYSGSLGDVTTLRSTISEFAALTGDRDIMFVMDKGFYSTANVITMLGNEEEGWLCKFLMAVPFSNKPPRLHIAEERENIDTTDNVVFTSNTLIRGVCRTAIWDECELLAHVFFDPVKELSERNELCGYVSSLKKKALDDPHNNKLAAEYRKYLTITMSEETGAVVDISIRNGVIAKKLETVGWFVLLSNHVRDPQTAYDAYRMKDVVEKGFLRYKNSLGLDRLRVHNDDRMQNKVFVAFIALIIASSIYETMSRQGLHNSMTLDRLLLTMDKLKSAQISGKTVLRPITREQSDILAAFSLPLPDSNTGLPTEIKKRGRKPRAG